MICTERSIRDGYYNTCHMLMCTISQLTPQPSLSASIWHPSSQSPSHDTSRKLSSESKSIPFPIPNNVISRSLWPALSRFISKRGHSFGTLFQNTKYLNQKYVTVTMKLFIIKKTSQKYYQNCCQKSHTNSIKTVHSCRDF